MDTSGEDDVKRLFEHFKKLKKKVTQSQDFIVHCEEETAYDFDLGSYETGEEREYSISITAKEGNFILKKTIIYNDNYLFDINFDTGIEQTAESSKMKSCNVTVSLSSGMVGLHTALFTIPYESERLEEKHVFIGLKAYCMNDEMKNIGPTAPYQRLRPFHRISKKIIPGEAPSSCDDWKSLFQVFLGEYKPPNELRSKLTDNTLRDKKLTAKLEEDLNTKNYKEKFENLLYIEEILMAADMRRYDMHNVQMEESGGYLSLVVPGLAENRPSLVIGDRVIVTKSVGDDCAYEGFIHEIEQQKVLFRFHYLFHQNFIRGQACHVRFELSRFTIRLQHRAVELAYDLLKCGKFPYLCLQNPQSPTNSAINKSESKIKDWFDETITDNDQQQTAIRNILRGSSKPYPYIIFGPPGTGKTVTVVEAMRQVLSLIPDSYILACAPSNNAADILLKRLLQHKIPTEMENSFLRFNARGRSPSSLPSDLRPYCKLTFSIDRERFLVPDAEEIMRHRVVICTFATAGRLVSMGIPNTHFTHVFMDESGQATEPETLIPLANLLDPEHNNGSQVVMAGDIKQLGPVLRSAIAIKHGLSTSLMERLMTSCALYQRNDKFFGSYDQRYITKLINNYRSHRQILEVPNKLFYDDELKAIADKKKTTYLCTWVELPKQNFPIIFHGVLGKDEREETSPSFFNTSEVTTVMTYVKKLLDDKRIKVEPSDIGIISPYRQQVKKIRQCLATGADPREQIRVGSVEEFQGAEYQVIIISTVRSSEEYLKMDATFKLGFLKNPKRFNVAVTRAQALLIVVGNPFVLCKDENWKELINFCKCNGGYTGATHQEAHLEHIRGKFKNLKLSAGPA